MLAMAAALGIGRFVYTPILPLMQEALHLSAGAAGLIASANFLGYVLGALVAAVPSLPGNRRSLLLAALAISSATTIGMAAGTTLFHFVAFRFLGGVASAFVLVFASTLVLERLAAAGRSTLSPIHFAGVGVGITVSAVTVSLLSSAGMAWRALWASSGLVALGLSAGVIVLVPDGEPARAAVPTSRTSDVRSGGLPILVLAYGLFGFGYVITSTFLVAMVRAMPSVRTAQSLIWAAFGVAAIPSVAVWTRLARRFGIARAFAAACVVEAIGVAASVLSPTIAGVYLAAVFLGGTFMGLTALGLVGARLLSTGDPRRGIGLMTASFGLGQMVGPVVAGLMHDRLGDFTAATMLAAGALVVAAALLAGPMRHLR